MYVLMEAARAALSGQKALLFTCLPSGRHAARIGDAWLNPAPCFEQALEQTKDARLPATCDTAGGRVTVEIFCAMPGALLVGGGHVAAALCGTLSRIGFRVRVADPRPDMLTPKRFPGAEELITLPYVEAASRAAPDGSDFYVLTPGHISDLEALREVLRRPRGYVGMLASRRKAASVQDTLRSGGFPEEVLREVHAPVGLSIGAITPEEIAISITSQAIAYHRLERGLGETQPLGLLTHLAHGGHGVLLSVVERQGSVPRGVGARMLLTDAGARIGSVGGGIVEHRALEAAALTAADGETRTVRVATRSGEIGCGGEVCVLVETI